MSDTPDGNFDDLWPEFLRIGLEVGLPEDRLIRIWGKGDRNAMLVFGGFQPKALRVWLTYCRDRGEDSYHYLSYYDFLESRE
jgi:hypothetical protein